MGYPWAISGEVYKINQLRAKGEHRLNHVMREGNKVADLFTNLTFHFAGTVEIQFAQNLPKQASALIRMDKLQIRNIRLRGLNEREPD